MRGLLVKLSGYIKRKIYLKQMNNINDINESKSILYKLNS